jgi:hypothetical protein
LRRLRGFFTMAEMRAYREIRVVTAAVLALALSSAGCVSAEQHRAALGDLQRLRIEAWQRSVEAAALRVALDQAAASIAQLRSPAAQRDEVPALAIVAARLDELARRQEAIAEEVRSAPVCVQAAAPDRTAQAAAPQPPARKVTDLLYSRF